MSAPTEYVVYPELGPKIFCYTCGAALVEYHERGFDERTGTPYDWPFSFSACPAWSWDSNNRHAAWIAKTPWVSPPKPKRRFFG